MAFDYYNKLLFYYMVLCNHIHSFDIFQIGPLRCWPGGLCLSRSIGDMDVGEFIVPVPYVKQIKVLCYCHSFFSELNSCIYFSFLLNLNISIHMQLSNTGGRLIIASDGIWDALTSEMAANSCRDLPAELAARQVVKVINRKFLSFSSSDICCISLRCFIIVVVILYKQSLVAI